MDDLMGRFRVASRELFNTYFRIDDPWNNNGWELEERFSAVELLLFEKLVTEPGNLPVAIYGTHQPFVHVKLRSGDFAPIMINREIDSGYWDFPIRDFSKDAQFSFIRFFDWELLSVRDSQYVRIRIDAWPSHPEAVGRDALVEARHIIFFRS